MTIRILRGRNGKSVKILQLIKNKEAIIFEYENGNSIAKNVSQCSYLTVNCLSTLQEDIRHNLSYLINEFDTFIFYLNITEQYLSLILEIAELLNANNKDIIITIQTDTELEWEEL